MIFFPRSLYLQSMYKRENTDVIKQKSVFRPIKEKIIVAIIVIVIW